MDVQGRDLVVEVGVKRADASAAAVGFDLVDHASHGWQLASADLSKRLVEHPGHLGALRQTTEKLLRSPGQFALE